MKKSIVSSFLLVAFSIIIFLGCNLNSKNNMTGIYLKSEDGISIIINEDKFPIIMNNKGEKNIFDDLKNGDTIEITYDTIGETFPGETQIYTCKVIKKGNIDDIPKDILNRLQDMGWSFDITN